MSHKLNLDEYLENPHDRLTYEAIEADLRKVRSENSPFSVSFYLKRGRTLAEAELAIVEMTRRSKNRNPHVSTLDYWLAKGQTLDEAKNSLNEYKTRIRRMPNLSELSEKYGHLEGERRYREHKDAMMSRPSVHLERLSSNPKEALIMRWLNLTDDRSRWGKLLRRFSYREDDLARYRLAVETATNLSLMLYYPDLRSLGSIDHKFSVYGGLMNKIHPLIVGCPNNLRAITRRENIRKGAFCSIEKAELLTYETVLNDADLNQNLRKQIDEVFVQES